MSNTKGTDGAPSNEAPTNETPTNEAPTNSVHSVDTQPVEEMSELTHIRGRKLLDERKIVWKIEGELAYSHHRNFICNRDVEEAVQINSIYERNTGFYQKHELDVYFAFLELPNRDMYYGTGLSFSRALDNLLEHVKTRTTW